MMNKIYLMKDEKRNFAMFKAGFATNLESRVYAYTTHNPLVECISFMNTRKASKHKTESMFHEEIKRRGYKFVEAVIDGKKTEWFIVSYDDPFYTELCEKGLNAFTCGKRRKNQGCYVLQK